MIAEQTKRDLAALLHHWLAYRRLHDRVPGLVATVTIDGERIHDGAYGLADVAEARPVNTDTIFRVASISKAFTSVAVLQLVERGEVQLDAPVARYLPWFRSAADDRIGRITVRHLLTHTGGVKRDGNTDHQHRRAFPNHVGLRRDLEDGVITFTANDRFKYSNYGIAVLGRLVEEVTGQSFADHQRAHIFTPLGMSRTAADWPGDHSGAVPDNVATGYSRDVPGPRQPCPSYPLRAYAPAYGMYTSANDLNRFAAAMLDGSLLSPETTREMFRTQWADGPGDITWGLGFRTLEIDGYRTVGAQGKFEGFETMLAIDPHRRIVAVVLMNAQAAPARALATGAIHATGTAIDRVAGGAPSGDTAAHVPSGDTAGHLTGIYRSLWSDRLIAAVGGRLYGFDPSADRLFDEPSELSLLDRATARMETDVWTGHLGEHMVFALGPDGRATSATVGGVTANRWFPPTD